jgi:IPT/TIG domain
MNALTSRSRPGGPIGRMAAVSVLLAAAFAFSVACPSLASAANRKVGVGMASPGEADGSRCQPEAYGGGPRSLTFADLKGGALEVPDDGRIVSWVVGGGVSEPDVMFPHPEASIVLDVFDPDISQHPHIFAQSPPAESFYQFDSTPMTIPPITVAAGDEVGVTLMAGGTYPNYFQATVYCTSRSTSGSEYGLWEPALVPGDSNGVVPTPHAGEIGVQAQVELDAPAIVPSGLTPVTGPSSGGQTVTIVGEHLSDASVEVSLPNAHEGDAGGFGSRAQLTENTDGQVKFTTPEAEVGEGPVDVRVKTAGGEVILKEVYEYKGALVPTIPLVVTGEATSITQTSAVLNATVNPRGLTVSSCGFTYGIGEAEGGEEEGEEEKHAPCSPLTFTGESAESVSAALTGLTPDTTYGYTVSADNETGSHGGFVSGSERTFKTLGIGEKSEEEKEKEAEKAKELAKELSGIAPAPTNTTPTIAPTPIPITPPKGLVATIPAVGLVGGGSATATPAGVVPVKVSCPSGETSCIGSITLTTIGAVKASAGHVAKAKKAVLTLATGSFTVAGGKTATVQLHLFVKAKALLRHTHTLHAQATIVAHDSAGATHTTKSTVTIHAAKAKARRLR